MPIGVIVFEEICMKLPLNATNVITALIVVIDKDQSDNRCFGGTCIVVVTHRSTEVIANGSHQSNAQIYAKFTSNGLKEKTHSVKNAHSLLM